MKRMRERRRPFWCGLLIGLCGIAPGVSGGALCVSFGYYERLLFAAAHPVKALKTDAAALLPLGVGIVLGMVVFGRGMARLFALFPEEMRFMVVGLIVGTFPDVLRQAKATSARRRWWAVTAVTFGLGCWLWQGGGHLTVSATPSFAEWALCGGVYAVGTVLPGVSASCMLLSMNAYESVLTMIGGGDLAALFPFSVGFAAVAAILVCIVNRLYSRCAPLIHYALAGLLAASVFPVIPPLSADKSGAVSLLLCGMSAAGTLWLNGKTSRKDEELYRGVTRKIG